MCEPWRQILQKELRISSCLWLTQYYVSTLSYCCPVLSNLLTSIYFFTLRYILLYCYVILTAKLYHFNNPFKSHCKSKMSSSFTTSQTFVSSASWKDIILASIFLIKRLANTDQDLKLRVWLKNSFCHILANFCDLSIGQICMAC